MVGGRPGRRLTEVTGQAGGNPLYARELADALVRGERVRVIEGIAEFADQTADVAVPASLADVISARLASLSEDALGVLRWAAVLGQEFSVIDLKVVTGLAASDLIEVVHGSRRRGRDGRGGTAAAVRARPDPRRGLREHRRRRCDRLCIFRRPARWPRPVRRPSESPSSSWRCPEPPTAG